MATSMQCKLMANYFDKQSPNDSAYGPSIRSRRPSAQPAMRISSASSADQDISRYQNWLDPVRRMRIDREKLEYFDHLLEHSVDHGQWLTEGMASNSRAIL